ncbi:hypothetical protein NP603_12570 [Methylomonas sp. SURF-1]|uniref:Uncharacterized protein n=1 Tax=Methylomonas aurea TaxID=2952224 RepID=A0ABT1UIB8_9GAMM|nr:hypothetical protein [Methylomonas sp. SURF-1]MCQ8181945.1 hypothetical protein [Methylomonas sp. SURF-1]
MLPFQPGSDETLNFEKLIESADKISAVFPVYLITGLNPPSLLHPLLHCQQPVNSPDSNLMPDEHAQPVHANLQRVGGQPVSHAFPIENHRVSKRRRRITSQTIRFGTACAIQLTVAPNFEADLASAPRTAGTFFLNEEPR